ncbi:mediator of RNA polymerase II transcription subunit 16 [Aspergillus puulaauensis]|uniref:Mediator of RNA polymerase II transcription subunit 16 n=1 Tax=Aspergillus puulaauensis TaxID=1220207 RepID=A0A7R8APB8_9EURO|nr:mediator complex subunit [Aspergillus puulaauensis]BCS25797.1 mediator complex subunit [Aspergillus puulaauensis]
MPLIMEDGINVDDLFGESASLELGLPPNTPPAKGLAQRLDEMRLVGCCQKIAWSRLGCVAYISQDASRVNVRHLQCQKSDGKWTLSDETPLNQVADAHDGHALVHLCWNESGSELAIADTSGRVSIYSIPIALNSVNGARQAAFDAADDGAQIVGMTWLNQNRSVHSFYQAAKVQGRWAYSPFRRRPIAPFHPVNKAALLCITRSGSMKLLYQNPDNKWAEITTELKNTSYSDRLLTHAALVATQAGILIATHSACQKISIYRVSIQWNPPQWDPAQQKQGSQPTPVPSFRSIHSKVEMPYNIPNNRGAAGENPDEQFTLTNSLYCLTSLQIILPASDNSAGSTPSPWIVAVFSIPPHAILHQQPQVPASAVIRWQLETGIPTLHPKFDEVASKKSNVQIKPKTILRRLDDITSDRHVISVDQTEYGNVLAVSYDDGSISFYDPKTMAAFDILDDANTVTSLAQAGFNYPLDAPAVHIGFSPSACAAVGLDSDGQIHLRIMEHSYGAENGHYDENKFSAAIASLTLAFCRGCGGEVNTDDILLLLIRQLPQDSQTGFLNEVYRALSINSNFTTEHDKLMNHPYISRALSIQAALGFKNKYKTRSIASNVPWAIIQLRQAAIIYPFFFQYNKGSQPPEPHDPDVLRMVLGNTKWILDFFLYTLNELFDLADEFESVPADQEAFNQKLKSTASLPLIVVLSSMSRAFLRFICRGLRGIHSGYANAPLTGDARIYYTEICHALETSPVRTDVYEKLLAGVDSAVRHAYTGAGFGDNERPGPEKELLVSSRIPPVLVTAVSTILRQTIPSIKAEVDRMAIFMGDYSWLGFGSDARTEAYRRSREVDIIKKTPIFRAVPGAGTGRLGTMDVGDLGAKSGTQGHLSRRCVRCCEVSEAVYPPRSVPALRMIYKLGHLRSCICGGMWDLESGLMI